MAHATEATEDPVPKGNAPSAPDPTLTLTQKLTAVCVGQGITNKQPKKETKLVTKLRRARNTIKARNVNGLHEDVHSDGGKWLDHMTRIHGRAFNTQRNQRIQDAYDNLSAPEQTTQQLKRKHSLYASTDKNVQREYSHRQQFSRGWYQVDPGEVPRASDSTRRTKFIGGTGVLVPNRPMEELLQGTPRSVREVEYKPPNYRQEAYLFQKTMGATVSDARPKSAVYDAQLTPKNAIKNLGVHPEWGKVDLKHVTDNEWVSSYMGMRTDASRTMKAKGNAHVWGFGNTQGSGGVCRSASDW